jgi:hypothetical protein
MTERLPIPERAALPNLRREHWLPGYVVRLLMQFLVISVAIVLTAVALGASIYGVIFLSELLKP